MIGSVSSFYVESIEVSIALEPPRWAGSLNRSSGSFLRFSEVVHLTSAVTTGAKYIWKLSSSPPCHRFTSLESPTPTKWWENMAVPHLRLLCISYQGLSGIFTVFIGYSVQHHSQLKAFASSARVENWYKFSRCPPWGPFLKSINLKQQTQIHTFKFST